MGEKCKALKEKCPEKKTETQFAMSSAMLGEATSVDHCAKTLKAIKDAAAGKKGVCNPSKCYTKHPDADNAEACAKSQDCQTRCWEDWGCKMTDAKKRPPPHTLGVLVTNPHQKMPEAKRRFAFSFSYKVPSMLVDDSIYFFGSRFSQDKIDTPWLILDAGSGALGGAKITFSFKTKNAAGSTIPMTTSVTLPLVFDRWYAITILVDMDAKPGHEMVEYYVDGGKWNVDIGRSSNVVVNKDAVEKGNWPKTNPWMKKGWDINVAGVDKNIQSKYYNYAWIPENSFTSTGSFNFHCKGIKNPQGFVPCRKSERPALYVEDLRFHPDVKDLKALLRVDKLWYKDFLDSDCAGFVVTDPCTRLGMCSAINQVGPPIDDCVERNVDPTGDGHRWVSVCTKLQLQTGTFINFMSRPAPRLGTFAPPQPVPGSKYKLIGEGEYCLEKKGCLYPTPMFPVMSLKKRVACRSWEETIQGKIVKKKECVITKVLDCMVFVGKDDFDYTGIPYFQKGSASRLESMGKHVYGENHCCNYDDPHMPQKLTNYYNCMRPTNMLAPELQGVWGFSQDKTKRCGVRKRLIPGLKTGHTVKCKDFNLKGRLVDPRAMYTPEEARKIWASDLEAWGMST